MLLGFSSYQSLFADLVSQEHREKPKIDELLFLLAHGLGRDWGRNII